MLHINTDERKKTKNNVKLEIVVKQISKLKNSTIISKTTVGMLAEPSGVRYHEWVNKVTYTPTQTMDYFAASGISLFEDNYE